MIFSSKNKVLSGRCHDTVRHIKNHKKNKWLSAELISSLHLILCIRNYMIRLQEIIQTEEIKCKFVEQSAIYENYDVSACTACASYHVLYIYYLLS
jgi:hypothetical protein